MNGQGIEGVDGRETRGSYGLGKGRWLVSNITLCELE